LGSGREEQRRQPIFRERESWSNGWEKNKEEEEQQQKTDNWYRLLGTSSLKKGAVWHVRLRSRRYLVTARQQLRKKALLANGWPLNNTKAEFSMGSGPRL
jgi:hypothetical protein